jgi:hypothetical protein
VVVVAVSGVSTEAQVRTLVGRERGLAEADGASKFGLDKELGGTNSSITLPTGLLILSWSCDSDEGSASFIFLLVGVSELLFPVENPSQSSKSTGFFAVRVEATDCQRLEKAGGVDWVVGAASD